MKNKYETPCIEEIEYCPESVFTDSAEGMGFDGTVNEGGGSGGSTSFDDVYSP